MPRPNKIPPELLDKARKWRSEGYSWRWLRLMTGLSLTQLKYHLVPGRKEERKEIMAKWYAANREKRLKRMRDYRNEKHWENARIRQEYKLRGKRNAHLLKPIPPLPEPPPKRMPKMILKADSYRESK